MDFLKAPGAEPSTFETVMAIVTEFPLMSALAAGLCIGLVCNFLGIGGWGGGGSSSDGGGWGDSGGGDGGGGGD